MPGLNKYDRKSGKFIRYTHNPEDPSTISNKTIWNLFIDHNNTLWISIYNIGIDLFDVKKGVTKRFRPDPEDPQINKRTIIAGSFMRTLKTRCGYAHKMVWIYLTDKTNSFKVIHFPDNDIAAVYKDKSGRIWVGTNTEGLFLCDEHGTILKKYDVKNILSGNRIHAITQDNSGKIWISGNHGLTRIDPEIRDCKELYQGRRVAG